MKETTEKVALVRTGLDVVNSMNKAIDLVGELKIKEELVLIKPNLCTATDPSYTSTVNPQLVGALIDRILDERELPIRIIESDSTTKTLRRAYERLGYLQLEKEYQSRGFDVSLVNLSTESCTNIEVNGLYFKNLELPEILIEPHYMISFAKARVQVLCGITGVLKNLFGCLPKKIKKVYHKHIDKVIVDVNKTINTDLCLIDGAVGREIGGETKNLGLFICGNLPASTDAILARVMGTDPTKIKHIKLASEHDLGTLQPEVVGEQVDSVSVKFNIPNVLIRTMDKYMHDTLVRFVKFIKGS